MKSKLLFILEAKLRSQEVIIAVSFQNFAESLGASAAAGRDAIREAVKQGLATRKGPILSRVP